MSSSKEHNGLRPWQHRLHEIIYEADTPAGKAFDLGLLGLILLSIILVMLESVKEISESYHPLFFVLEWVLTVLFSMEFVARLICIEKPMKYVFSFYGMVDLLSLLPTYLGLFIVTDTSSIRVIRSLRLLRIFRVLKLARYMSEANLIIKSLKASRAKITVFLFFVLCFTFILGTIMYLVEGGGKDSDFTSIPRSIYWAIVTMTTVGYGDISPETELGQFIASLVMLAGYVIIAVPTGIVSAEIVKVSKKEKVSTQACPSCSREGHEPDAEYCKFCGAKL